jgi:hypothetical protein
MYLSFSIICSFLFFSARLGSFLKRVRGRGEGEGGGGEDGRERSSLWDRLPICITVRTTYYIIYIIYWENRK